MKRLWIFIFIAGVAIIAMSAFQHLKRPGVGELAPSFSLASLSGSTVSLDQYRGKPVILHFWATFCAPCREELPSLIRFAKDMKNEGIAILAIAEDDGRRGEEEIRRFLGSTELPFPVLLDLDGRVADSYQSYGVPESFFVDRNGKIVTRVNNSVDWDSQKTRDKVKSLIGNM